MIPWSRWRRAVGSAGIRRLFAERVPADTAVNRRLPAVRPARRGGRRAQPPGEVAAVARRGRSPEGDGEATRRSRPRPTASRAGRSSLREGRWLGGRAKAAAAEKS